MLYAWQRDDRRAGTQLAELAGIACCLRHRAARVGEPRSAEVGEPRNARMRELPLTAVYAFRQEHERHSADAE